MRQDQWQTTVIIDGVRIGDTWDTATQGDIDSDTVKYRPGGMKNQISLGGNRNVANITVSKLLDLTSGDWDALRAAQAKVGKGVSMVVGRQPLDPNGNPFGTPLTYTGTLKTIIPPDHQSDGTPTAALWQAVCDVADCT